MCGRYSVSVREERLIERYHVRDFPKGFTSRYNAAPSQQLPVILNTDPETIRLERWGLLPKWIETTGRKDGLINVRLETLREKHTFTRNLKTRRCLIPADGFYEWKKSENANEKGKTPYRITVRDGAMFSFAGIWEENEWKGERVVTFAIITTEPNELLRPIHSRMPVILPPVFESQWLGNSDGIPRLLEFLKPYPASLMQAYPVSRLVNNARIDVKDVIEPFPEAE